MVNSDASHQGLGCVLMQHEKVVVMLLDSRSLMSEITPLMIWS